jgi:hypothetical protein
MQAAPRCYGLGLTLMCEALAPSLVLLGGGGTCRRWGQVGGFQVIGGQGACP